MNIKEQLERRLRSVNADYQILDHDPVTTMRDVERVLGVSLSQTAKTLVVQASNRTCLVAIPGDKRLDKRKLAKVLGVSRDHLDLLSPEAVEAAIGIPLGAIPPFHPDHLVVMDERLLRLPRLYCGCGNNTSTLVVEPKSLQCISQAVIGDIVA
jgi:prolyl-tRNA editing enzyme YbaK/EbsC (Cys-tRNA(Pro) deacylase)